MNSRKKILIGFAGGHSLTPLIKDLKMAGIPQQAEVMVLTVVDAFVFPVVGEGVFFPDSPAYIEAARQNALDKTKKEVAAAGKIAGEAAARLRDVFPRWKVYSKACADSPAWAIIKQAGEWKADLVIVGAHHQTAAGRFFLGSVAQKVVVEAPCSVRIVHGDAPNTVAPVRIVAGVDGSANSELVVGEIASRSWRKGSSVRLVTAVDLGLQTAAAALGNAKKWFHKGDEREGDWIRRMSDSFEKKIKKSGLTVSTVVKDGNPKQQLLKEAEKWGADCIFVGARGLNMIERFLIGSVSAAVAARASCSVEVVRPKVKWSAAQSAGRKK